MMTVMLFLFCHSHDDVIGKISLSKEMIAAQAKGKRLCLFLVLKLDVVFLHGFRGEDKC